jgi:hypothetical protein
VDIATIRDALKARIETIEGLNVESLRDNPEVPCAIVLPKPPFNLNLTWEDSDQRPAFTVLLLVAYVDTDGAQDQLDEYLSNETDQSVAVAIETDASGKNQLDGVVNSATVTTIDSYEVISMVEGGTRYLSAQLTVEIYV